MLEKQQPHGCSAQCVRVDVLNSMPNGRAQHASASVSSGLSKHRQFPQPPQTQHGLAAVQVLTVRDILAYGVEDHMGARVELEEMAMKALRQAGARGFLCNNYLSGRREQNQLSDSCGQPYMHSREALLSGRGHCTAGAAGWDWKICLLKMATEELRKLQL